MLGTLEKRGWVVQGTFQRELPGLHARDVCQWTVPVMSSTAGMPHKARSSSCHEMIAAAGGRAVLSTSMGTRESRLRAGLGVEKWCGLEAA